MTQSEIDQSPGNPLCATLLGIALIAQDNPPPTPPANIDLTGIPAARGIYFRTAGEWVALSSHGSHALRPTEDRWRSESSTWGRTTRRRKYRRHSGIPDRQRSAPDLLSAWHQYHGSVSGSQLKRKPTIANWWMPISRHFKEWAHYRDKDLTDIGRCLAEWMEMWWQLSRASI